VTSDVNEAVERVVEQISTAAEFFPLQDLIGEESFVKAVKLFGTIREGSDEQKKKYSEMVQTLIDDYGYTADSAEEVLTYAANHLWRDS
jgi:predicted Ser/Thr protein kinase